MLARKFRFFFFISYVCLFIFVDGIVCVSFSEISYLFFQIEKAQNHNTRGKQLSNNSTFLNMDFMDASLHV